MRVWVFVMGLLLGQAAAAGEWIADGKGCKVWNPVPKPAETVVWSGACKNGFAEGEGTLLWFLDGKPNGRDMGMRLQGLLQGHVVSEAGNGNHFEGDYKDGKRTGKGVFVWVNGDRYEGDFLDAARTGKGVYVWANGDRYEGDFLAGARTGKGVYSWASGNHYVGDFVASVRTGQGVFTWADKSIYEGGWRDNLRQGYGRMINKVVCAPDAKADCATSETFEGYWQDGQFVFACPSEAACRTLLEIPKRN